MGPTLRGRIQTRLALLLFVGLPWTLAVTPLLPTARAAPSLATRYQTTLGTLAAVAVLGVVVWEPIYHLLQQLRWEKDWPSLFALAAAVPEAVLVRAVHPSGDLFAFGLHFASTWVAMWLVAIGPIRVVHLRWRFRGGEFL